MDTFEAIRSRRSVKHFDPNHSLSEAEIRQLMEAAMLSPSSFNVQHWRFVIVSDTALRQQLRAASWNQAQVTDASLLVIITADLKAHAKEPARYWRHAPEQVSKMIVPMIGKFYDNQELLQRDEAIRSGSMAAQTLMLAARAMGYDSCPMIGFDPAKVGTLINLPQDHVVVMMLPIGRAISPASQRSGPIDYSEAVIRNRFS